MEPFSVIGRNDKTEKGYNYAMRKNILGTEAEIRRKNDEELLYFDRKGNLKGKIQGKGFEVNIPETEILKDKIVTHNHPRALSRSGIKAIGNSFSLNDSVKEVKKWVQFYNNQIFDTFLPYATNTTKQQRAEVAHYHKVNKLVANHFGWNYTKKNK